MKNMRENMGGFETTDQTKSKSPNSETFTKTEAGSSSSSKGDYIDFEEIK